MPKGRRHKQRCVCVERKRERKRKRERERERENTQSFVLRGFIPSLKIGILGEVPGEDLNGILISFLDVSFQGHGLY